MGNNSNTNPPVMVNDPDHMHKRESLKGTFSGMRTVLDRMRGNYCMHKLRQKKRRRKMLFMIITVIVIVPLLIWAAIIYVRN